MANPNNSEYQLNINQNTNPVDTAALAQRTYENYKNFKILDENRQEVATSENFATQSQQEAADRQRIEIEKQRAEENIKQQQAQGFIENSLDLGAGFARYIGSGLLNIVSSLEDMAGYITYVPNLMIDAFDKAIAGTNLKENDIDINPIKAMYDGIDYAIGKQGEAGNVFSRTADEMSEYASTFNQVRYGGNLLGFIPVSDNGWSEYLINGTNSVMGNAVPFIAEAVFANKVSTGLKIGRFFSGGYKLLGGSKIPAHMVEKAGATLFNSAILTTTTGHMLANETYNNVYNDVMEKLSPGLKDLKNQAYTDAYEETLRSGGSLDEAQYNGSQAQKEIVKQFAKDHQDLHLKADKFGKDGAIVAANVNFIPSMLLNIGTAGLFTRSSYFSRELLKSPSRFSGREIAKEMGQEALEEAIIEGAASEIGYSYGMGKLDGNWSVYKGLGDAAHKLFGMEEINGKSEWNGWKTLETGLWAAAAGGLIAAGGQAMEGGPQKRWGDKTRKERYEEQQELIKFHNSIGTGGKDIIDTVTTLNNSSKEVLGLAYQMQELKNQGKHKEASQIGERILAVQAMNAFKSGTTESLIKGYEDIAANPKMDKSVRERAAQGVELIKKLENVYEEVLYKYGHNASEVFSNRANALTLEDLETNLNKELNSKKQGADKALLSAIRNGDLSLSGKSMVEVLKQSKEGFNTIEKEEQKFHLDYTIDELLSDENPHAPESEQAKVWNSFKEKAKNDVEEFRELNEINESIKSVKKQLDETNKEYNEVTSKEYQKSLRFQEKFVKEFENKQSQFVEKKGTDEYLTESFKILDKYKNNLTVKQYNTLKRNIEQINHLEKLRLQNLQKEEIRNSVQNEQDPETAAPINGSGVINKNIQNPNATGNTNTQQTLTPEQEALIESIAIKLKKNEALTDEEKAFYRQNPKVVKKRIQDIENKTTSSGQQVVTTDDKLNALNSFITNTAGATTSNVNPISNSEINKVLNAKTDEEIEKINEVVNGIKNNSNFISNGKVSIPAVKKKLGSMADAVIDALVIDKVITKDANGDYVKPTVKTKPQLSKAASDLLNSKHFGASQQSSLVDILPINMSKMDNKKKAMLEKIIDEIDDAIKNNTLTDYEVVRNVNDDPDVVYIYNYKNASLSPAEVYEDYGDENSSYSPAEFGELNEEMQTKVKNFVDDYTTGMKQESSLSYVPTFEDMLKDLLGQSEEAMTQLQQRFNLLKEGWKLNKHLPQISDSQFQSIYSRLFDKKTKKELFDEFILATEQAPRVELTTEEVNEQNEEVKNSLSNNVIVVEDTPMGIRQEAVAGSLKETNAKLAFNSTNALLKTNQYEGEEGETVVESWYENENPDELTKSPIFKFEKLLDPDDFLPGTVLNASIPEQAVLNQLKMPLRDEDPMSPTYGNILIDEKTNKNKYESYSSWLSRNLEKNPDFLSSQEYYDSVPILIKDSQGDYVAYIHDVKWYMQTSFTGDRQEGINNTRKLRKQIIDSHRSGLEFNVKITEKKSGTFNTTKNYEPVSKRDSEAQIAIRQKNGDLRFDGKKVTVTIEQDAMAGRRPDGTFRLDNQPVVVQRWGTNENGIPTFIVTSAKASKLKPEIGTTLYHSVLAYLHTRGHSKKTDPENAKYHDIANQIKKLMISQNYIANVEWSEFDNLSKLLKQNVFLSTVNLPAAIAANSDFNSKANAIHKHYQKVAEENPKLIGKSYFQFENRSIVFGIIGEQGGQILLDDMRGDLNSPAMKEAFELLKSVFLNENLYFDPTAKDVGERIPLFSIDDNFNFVAIEESYDEYVKNNIETNVATYDIDTNQGPKKVTRLNPIILIEPTSEAVGTVNRKAEYEKPVETSGAEAQKNNYTAEVIFDEDLDKAIEEAIDFSFIGETKEEKREDAKQMLSENTNQATEFREQHLDPKDDKLAEGDNAEVEKLVKQAEVKIKWVTPYVEGLTLEDLNEESFSPAEISSETVQELLKSVFKIEGLNPDHQQQLVDFAFNQITGEFKFDKAGIKNKKEIVSKIVQAIKEKANESESVLNDTIRQLKLIPDYNSNPKVKELIAKYELALSKVKLITDNSEVIAEESIAKLYKYAGLKAKTIKDEDGNLNTVLESKDGDELGEDDTLENSEDDTVEDSLGEREDNYSQTSLEKNNKNSITAELRLFLSGIPNKSSKSGNAVLGVMGVPTYVEFDTIFNTLQAILADHPVNFEIQLALLENYKNAHPWMTDVIAKLKSADKQIQNAFSNKMGTHALKMEFIMYSFDLRSGNYSLRVTDTNQLEITKKVLSNWYNGLYAADNPLITEIDGEYHTDKTVAEELLNEYKSWFGNISNKATAPIGKRLKDIAAANSKATSYKLNPNSKADEVLMKADDGELGAFAGGGGKIMMATKKGNVITYKEVTQTPVEKALMRYDKLSTDEKNEAIDAVQRWLSYFGIELADSAVEQMFTMGMYSATGTTLNPKDIFNNKISEKDSSPIINLASWLSGIVNGTIETDITNPDPSKERNNPLRNSSVEKALSKLQAKHSKAIVTNSFRDGKKSIYGFTAFKFITDRFNDLKKAASNEKRTEATDDIINQLKSLSFSERSFWLNMFQSEHMSKFEISHMGLTALIEKGKKIYKDNSITSLSDVDHEVVKFGLHQDINQGHAGNITIGENQRIIVPLRMSRFMSPTNSDKSTITIIKAPSLDLRSENLYDINPETGDVFLHPSVIDFVFEQTVLPEIIRLFNHKELNPNGTNIKGYDEGAKMLFFLPNLNDLMLEVNGKKFKLNDYINDPNVKLEDFISRFKSQLIPAVDDYVRGIVNEKISVWERNGNTKYFDSKYMSSIDNSKTKIDKNIIAAFDFEVNQLIANANSFMTIIGDPAVYYKGNPTDSFLKQAEDTLTNLGKRLASMIAPGSKIANSENEQYYQLFLEDRVDMSENIEFLTELLDNKKFDRDRYNKIISMPVDSNDEIERENLKKEKKDAMKEFSNEYPNSNAYFNIEATDAQEYTTWREHLHILEGLGRIQDAAMTITPEEIREAKEMFANNVPLEKMTDAQRAILKKVMQPIKPVYTGQVYDKDQDVMRMVYIKTSSFPLIPQLTSGLELDKLRLAMQGLEESTMARDENNKPIGKPQKHVRASHQSGNKVGSVKNPLKLYDKSKGITSFEKTDEKGNTVIDTDRLIASSLTLNRKDFKIQLDVPYKSFSKNEDTVSMGTQLTKLLFGNGIMKEGGFKYNGETLTGLQLYEKFNTVFDDLISLKKDELCEELGINPLTFKPTNVKETALKLQKLLQEEAINKGYSKQNIDALEIQFIGDPENPTGFKFSSPLWMTADSNKFESLLNSIVSNRILKIKLPGASYVAGSEAGFKFQSDFKDVDKNKIVWTKKWDKNKGLQAAKFDGQGKLLSAQVIAPSKFRKKDGSLIDLLEMKDGEYTYVDKTSEGFKLKEGKIGDELLKIISFRVPTSAHVSGCQLEIVGFIPNESGDLMIVPSNLTTQKGLDFDIDKETTYQLWHTVLDNGTILPLSPKSKNKEKVLQNEIIKIHHSIFGSKNPNVQKKINSVLSIEYAKEQAKEIDKLNTKDKKYFSPLSSEYQKQKMFLGASGKIGIGAFSLDVTSHSLFQQANTVNPKNKIGLVYPVEGGYSQFSMNFGEGLDSDGLLGRDETIDGDRTISEVLMELQNIATDNEKEQVMGKVNINSYTLDVIKTITMLGFDKGVDGKSIPFLFLSQPIIKDYVLEIANASSNVAEFSLEKKKQVLDSLAAKYGFESISDTTLEEKMSYDKSINLDTEVMGSELKDGHNSLIQKQILNRFLILQHFGEQIRGLQTSINTDSKGLPKSVLETQEKIESLTKNVFSNKFILNANKIIGEEASLSSGSTYEQLISMGYVPIGDTFIKPTTVAGKFSVTSLSAASMLWDDYFPYNAPLFTKLSNEIIALMNLSEAGESKKVEKKQLIVKELKKFLNSKAVDILMEGNDIQAERFRLFFDVKSEGKVSLASYTQKLLKHPYFRKNNFLQTLSYNVSDKIGKPSLIKFDNTASGNFDESYMHNAILQLMNDNIKLPDFNGEEYSTKKLAQDLINYAILEGGVQEVIQFMKLIPISYLKEMGFSTRLSQYGTLRSDAASRMLGVTFDKKKGVFNPTYRPSNFAIQFAQSNPGMMPKLDNINPNMNDKTKAALIKKDTITLEDIGGTSVMSPDSMFPFVSLRVDGEYHIWMKNGNSYSKIPTLGIFGMTEYNPNIAPGEIATSIITRGKTKPQTEVITAPPPIDPIIPSAESKALSAERFGLGSATLSQIVSNIANDTSFKSNSYFNKIANAILKFVPNDVKIVVAGPNEQLANGKYSLSANTITISYAVATGDKTLLAKTILKEVVHSITDGEILKYADRKTSELTTQNAPKHIKSLVMLYDSAKRGLEKKYGAGALQKVIDKVNKQKEKNLTKEEKEQAKLDEKEARVIYGGYNILEFVEMMMTEPEFQKEMSELEYGASSNVFERFLKFISELFESLGIDVKQDTVTAQAINEIFTLMNEKQPQSEVKPTPKQERKTITYKPVGREKQTYFIIGTQIFNSKGDEVFASPSRDRRKIFANLAVQEGRAIVIKDKHPKTGQEKIYIVNDRNQILNNDGEEMQWGEENGDRKRILDTAKKEFESKKQQSKPKLSITSDIKNVFLEVNNLYNQNTPEWEQAVKDSGVKIDDDIKANYPEVAKILEEGKRYITNKEYNVIMDNLTLFEQYIKNNNINSLSELSDTIVLEQVEEIAPSVQDSKIDVDKKLKDDLDNFDDEIQEFQLSPAIEEDEDWVDLINECGI